MVFPNLLSKGSFLCKYIYFMILVMKSANITYCLYLILNSDYNFNVSQMYYKMTKHLYKEVLFKLIFMIHHSFPDTSGVPYNVFATNFLICPQLSKSSKCRVKVQSKHSQFSRQRLKNENNESDKWRLWGACLGALEKLRGLSSPRRKESHWCRGRCGPQYLGVREPTALDPTLCSFRPEETSEPAWSSNRGYQFNFCAHGAGSERRTCVKTSWLHTAGIYDHPERCCASSLGLSAQSTTEWGAYTHTADASFCRQGHMGWLCGQPRIRGAGTSGPSASSLPTHALHAKARGPPLSTCVLTFSEERRQGPEDRPDGCVTEHIQLDWMSLGS